MVGETEGHRRGVVLRITRLAQGHLRVEPIVGKNRSGEQGIPGRIAFGKGMGFAREGVEMVAQAAVEAFDIDRAGCVGQRSQRGNNFDRHEMAPRIPVLNGLGEP